LVSVRWGVAELREFDTRVLEFRLTARSFGLTRNTLRVRLFALLLRPSALVEVDTGRVVSPLLLDTPKVLRGADTPWARFPTEVPLTAAAREFEDVRGP
jgi:hypothetical protein